MKHLETDVIVIAAGTAGLPAAIKAAEKGARVIVFEKNGYTGGCGNMASGLLAVESRIQRKLQLPITKEGIFNYFMDFTHWRADAKLIRDYINKTAGTISWLEGLGVQFRGVESHGTGNNYTWHVIEKGNKPGASGSVMMKILTKRAQDLGVQIYLKTPAKKIIKQRGKITGIIAQDESGAEIRVSTKAVIVATGGFADNLDWVKKYTGLEFGKDITYPRIKGLVGDGLRMAWEVGAAESLMIMHAMSAVAAQGVSPDLMDVFYQPNIAVNLDGERFINEEIISSNNMFTGNALALQKKKCAFMIIDESIKNQFSQIGYDINPFLGYAPEKAAGFDAAIKQTVANKIEGVYMADSLEALAGQTGINPEGLRKTIHEYNIACETGRDYLFDRKLRYLRPLIQPKYYALKLLRGAFGSLGGIKINHRTEVLNIDDEVIPGLYAAGADAEAIYGDTYPITLPGCTMGFAVNSGCMAGENAAEYVMGKS